MKYNASCDTEKSQGYDISPQNYNLNSLEKFWKIVDDNITKVF